MPGLASFCVCTAIGLGSIYLLQISWFVAWLSLDQKRIQERFNSFLPCIAHQDTPDASSKKGWKENCDRLAVTVVRTCLSSAIFKLAVAFLSIGFLSVGIWGSLRIKQKFDPTLLLPSDSYLRDFLDTNNQFFPEKGWSAYVYTASLDHSDLGKIDNLTQQLTELHQQNLHLGGNDFSS